MLSSYDRGSMLKFLSFIGQIARTLLELRPMRIYEVILASFHDKTTFQVACGSNSVFA